MKIGIVLPTSDPAQLADQQALYSSLSGSNTEISTSILDERVPFEADPVRTIADIQKDGSKARIAGTKVDGAVHPNRKS